MKLIVIDQEGVLCETVRGHDRPFDRSHDRAHERSNTACRLLAGAAEAIARFNHAGYRVAVLQDCTALHRGACDMDGLNRRHADLQQALAAHGARIDLMLFADALPQTLHDLMQRLRVPGAHTTVVSGSPEHLHSALQAGCRAIRLLSAVQTGKQGMAPSAVTPEGAGRGRAIATIPEDALVRVNLGAVANELAH